MLQSLRLEGVGPVDVLDVEFASRTNLFTGDNGLGKTFLLDIAWWALTRGWSGPMALPAPRPRHREPRIEALIQGRSGPARVDRGFNFEEQSWPFDPGRPAVPGLVLYAQVDGGFAVWDPLRSSEPSEKGRNAPFLFRADDVWNGLRRDDIVLCNGLIADVVTWQLKKSRELDRFQAVLRRLSPPDQELRLGAPGRPTEDVRDVPMLEAPYGLVPLTHASAGVKRIVQFAYLMTWAWHEHVRAAELRETTPDRQVILLVDEIEAHLHPKWQQRVLPALRDVVDELSTSTNVQIICATHSPLVLASIDPYFDPAQDALTRLDLQDADALGRRYPIAIREQWTPRSDAASWLSSEVFDEVGTQAPRVEELIDAFDEAVAASAAERALGAYRDLARIVAPENDDVVRLRSLLRQRGWYHATGISQ